MRFRCGTNSKAKGFALPVVLTSLTLVSLYTSLIGTIATDSYRYGAVRAHRTREDWILKAGLNRAVKALLTPGDILRKPLLSGEGSSWHFGGETLILKLQPESEKLDINFADRQAIRNLLSTVIGADEERVIAEADQHVEDMRNRQVWFTRAEALLTTSDRLGPKGLLLRQSFTVFTGQPTPVSPRHGASSDQDDFEGLRPMRLSSSVDSPPFVARPIYRIIATLAGVSNPPQSRPSQDVTIIVSENEPTVFRVVEGSL